MENLSLRGKNLYFYDVIIDALKFDLNTEPQMKIIKNACTEEAVLKIHEAILEIWPSLTDLTRVYEDISDDTTGFYSGFYSPKHIIRGVLRHTFYSDRILLMEPFQDPRLVREKYNPLHHPGDHIENTLIGLRFMLLLYPWVEAGLVSLIRSPASFDVRIQLDSMNAAKLRIKQHPVLEKILNESGFLKEQKEEMMEQLLLANPDSKIREMFLEFTPDASTNDIEKYLAYVQWKRDNHPFFTPMVSEDFKQTRSPLLMMTSGANYDLTRIITSLTQSHLITDMDFRWAEMKVDRETSGFINPKWEGFAKAFQQQSFSFLNDIPLHTALELRKENHIENLRTFLARLWRNNKLEDDLSDENIKILEEELRVSIQEAKIEWKSINRELRNWLGIDGVGAIVGIATPFASGNADLFLGGLGVAAILQLISNREKKHEFKIKHPAGFFLDLK